MNKKKNNLETDALDSIRDAVERLLAENTSNLEDPSDTYARGYHDALVDVMNVFHIPHQERPFD